jgi:hypothetical protein
MPRRAVSAVRAPARTYRVDVNGERRAVTEEDHSEFSDTQPKRRLAETLQTSHVRAWISRGESLERLDDSFPIRRV